MRKSVIVSAVRTPVGKRGGLLKGFQKSELAGIAMKEALKRANLEGNELDDVLYGSIGGLEYRSPARHFWLEAGLPIEVPAITLNRACSTSLTAVAMAAAQIGIGLGDTYMVGGVEMDSRTVYRLVNNAPYNGGMPVVSNGFYSPVSFGNEAMPKTAENIAQRLNITREECDQFAVRSHQLAAKGYQEGIYQEHVISIQINQKNKDSILMDRDEILRETSIEQLAKLNPVVKDVDHGVVTAGNSSPLNDGASAAIVMNEEKARALGLKPLMRFVDYTVTGLDPHVMGLGPVSAMRKLMERNRMELSDLDFIECNEAFAAQSLGVIQELDLDINKVNVRGGAIALGHPGSATGINLVAKACSLMKALNSERCAITFCNGGGMGVAALFENCI